MTPVLVLMAALALGAGGMARPQLARALGASRGSRRGSTGPSDDPISQLARLTALGVTAGLGLQEALSLAAGQIDRPIRAEIEDVLRSARKTGLMNASAAAVGDTGEMFRLLARSGATGAPVVQSLLAVADDRERSQLQAHRLAAKRLPLKLMLPLALLILPGFVLLLIGPTLVDAVGRLADPL